MLLQKLKGDTMKIKSLKFGKLYTSKKIIELTSFRNFQDLLASGRLEWVTDNSFGFKLYRLNV